MQLAPVRVEGVILEQIAQACRSLRWASDRRAAAPVAAQRISRR
jgi:hypothetical protein